MRGRPNRPSGKYRDPITNEPIGVFEWRKKTGKKKIDNSFIESKNTLDTFKDNLKKLVGFDEQTAINFIIQSTKTQLSLKLSQ